MRAVVITGSNLFGHADNITEVRFGDIPADIDYTASTNTRIRVRIQSSGVTSDTSVAVVITATTSAIVESSGNDWTYLVPGRITSVDPDIGQVGTMVTITGKASMFLIYTKQYSSRPNTYNVYLYTCRHNSL